MHVKHAQEEQIHAVYLCYILCLKQYIDIFIYYTYIMGNILIESSRETILCIPIQSIPWVLE